MNAGTTVSMWPGSGGYVAIRSGNNVNGPNGSGEILACIEGDDVYFGTFPTRAPDLTVRPDGGVYAGGKRIFTIDGRSIRDGYQGHFFLTADQEDPMALAAAAGIHVGDYRLRTQHDSMITMDDITNEAALWKDKWDRFGTRRGQRDHNRLDPTPPPGIKAKPYGDDFLGNQRLSQMPIERGVEPWQGCADADNPTDHRDVHESSDCCMSDEEAERMIMEQFDVRNRTPKERIAWDKILRRNQRFEDGVTATIVVGVIVLFLRAICG